MKCMIYKHTIQLNYLYILKKTCPWKIIKNGKCKLTFILKFNI